MLTNRKLLKGLRIMSNVLNNQVSVKKLSFGSINVGQAFLRSVDGVDRLCIKVKLSTQGCDGSGYAFNSVNMVTGGASCRNDRDLVIPVNTEIIAS